MQAVTIGLETTYWCSLFVPFIFNAPSIPVGLALLEFGTQDLVDELNA